MLHPMGTLKKKAKPVTFKEAGLYLSIEEAAHVAKVKPQTIRNWFRDNVLQMFRFKSLILCSKEEVLARKKEMDQKL